MPKIPNEACCGDALKAPIWEQLYESFERDGGKPNSYCYISPHIQLIKGIIDFIKLSEMSLNCTPFFTKNGGGVARPYRSTP